MSEHSPIAIVGIGGVFPDAPNVDTFWENISRGHDAVREVPEERWALSMEDAFASEKGAADHVFSKRGCFIESLPKLPSGMSIDTDWLEQLDPSFRVLLAAGGQAFQDARFDEIDLSRVGVMIGNLALPTDSISQWSWEILGQTFEEKVLAQSGVHPNTGVHPLNRYVAGLPAGVLANALGLGGGSLTLDAACSSSLYALKLAVDELQAGRADAMLAGGLSRPSCLYTQMGFSQLRALSPTGLCSPFDANGNGLVVGEGSGILVLKRLDDAQAQGDQIYAVLRGIGLSNDIGGSLLAPMSEGQLRAMRSAYEQAGLTPQDMDLIECHATGTPVGDLTEVESLRALWGTDGWESGQCVIGSVKSNIGHLLTAAGSAALIKVIQAMKHASLPSTANFNASSPQMHMDDSPFRVLNDTQEWKTRDASTPRRAAVSAFGFGGINAHVLLEQFDDASAKSTSTPIDFDTFEPEPIAVVGMDAWYGAWGNLRAFQERVLGGGESHAVEPSEQWWGVEQSAWYRMQGHTQTPFKGYFLKSLDVPANAFRIPPNEIKELLPQQLLMLQVAARAMADCVQPQNKLSEEQVQTLDERTGVYIGLGLDLNTTNYHFRWVLVNHARRWARQLGLDLSEEELSAWVDNLREASGPALSANGTMGGLGSIAASRIAREFKFGGPSHTISSEETSSLRSVEVAVRALQRGEIDRALAGGVDLAGDVRSVLGTHGIHSYSQDEHTNPFDPNSTGALIGEGAGAMVLKRLSDAERDGDRIYSVIRGVGVAHGGDIQQGTPAETAYNQAVERACNDAGVGIESLRFIETHGSGTPEEDSVEARALARLFKDSAGDRCLVSSVKSRIGHAGAASGIASIIKTSLSLYQEIVPPLDSADSQLAPFDSADNRLHASREPHFWLRNREDGPQRAGVSGMSVDGNAIHMVLEAYDHDEHEAVTQRERLQPLGARSEGLFAVEAQNVQALEIGLARLRSHVEDNKSTFIEGIARTWWHENREDATKAMAITLVARHAGELLDQIDYCLHALDKNPDQPISGSQGSLVPPHVRDRVFFSPEPLGHDGKIGFIYPGSGNQFMGMGRELSVQWPEVFRRQDRENKFLRNQFQPDVFWNTHSVDGINKNHKATLFGQVTLGTATSDLIQSFGVTPESVIGYSLGETAGLFALKAWTDRDSMLERINASTLFTEDLAGEYKAARKVWKVPSNSTVDWALGVIDRPAKVVRAALSDHKKVYNLIVNTLQECVVGGDPRAVEKLVKKLDCEFFPLHGVTTVHCEVAKEVQEPYRALHVLPTTPPKNVQFYSGASGTAYNVSSESAADSVLNQALYGIDYPKVIEAAYEDGVRIFLEMGPGGSCSRMITDILEGRPHMARSVCVQSRNATTTVLRTVAQLLAERVPVDLSVLYGQATEVVGHQAAEATTEPGISIPIGGKPFEVVLPNRQTPEIDEPLEEFAENSDLSFEQINEPEVNQTHESPYPIPDFNIGAAGFGGSPTATAGIPDPIAAPEPVGVQSSDPVLNQWAANEAEKAKAHEAYLKMADETNAALTQAVQFQMQLLQQMQANGETEFETQIPPIQPLNAQIISPVPPIENTNPNLSVSAETPLKPAMDRPECMEFATGSIGLSMGAEWQEVDAHPTRVRLPDEPLMLVDRIVSFHGEARSMTNGRVVTEHDVLPGAWYLDHGRIPTCICVEAGQADLILSAYLGIDFETKGLAMYRLLDAQITFHRGLPVPGETIHFDIRVERFFRQGDTWLFRFNYDATVKGQPLLTMRNGCAGFFTREELDAGVGVVRTEEEMAPQPGILPADWRNLVPMEKEAYSDDQVAALRRGDYATAFGSSFASLGIQNPVKIPDGKMNLVDRIVELDPTGGQFGIGIIRGEMDIHPDDWFLTCHFVDDMVMPGTLMYECCLHTLRIYLMRMGWVGEADTVAFEPVPGETSMLKCRGEVNESSSKVIYQITIKELGYNPAPYAIANCIMYVDGKTSIQMDNMAIQMTGWTRKNIEVMWGSSVQTPAVPANAKPLFDYASILAFSSGKPSDAFGEPYAIFDEGRKIARLPRPPFQFLDRVIAIDAPQWEMKAGGTIVAEYDVPSDEWYFDSNRQPYMPFSVLLETALQPCGWMAAYMGSALTSDVDLKFRNLGGNATQFIQVPPDVGTLTTHVKCTGVSSSGGMIIQNYEFDMYAGSTHVYKGDTYFGYFSEQALADQIGIRDAKLHQPTEAEQATHPPFDYPTVAPYPDDTMRMVGRVEIYDPLGGPEGLGFIRSTIEVNPEAWFFQAHFYEDPVWPGSLGLEGFLQLVKLVAIERWGVNEDAIVETVATNNKHSWVYRGQVIPKDAKVTMEASIIETNDQTKTLKANGYLSVDGRDIYQMTGFEVRLVRA
jgi:PfaB family protein